MVVDLCLTLGNLTCYHKASLQPEPSKVPCRFMGQFLCMALPLWPPSVFQGSLCLLSSARQLGSKWIPSLCAMVQKVLEAESTSDWRVHLICFSFFPEGTISPPGSVFQGLKTVASQILSSTLIVYGTRVGLESIYFPYTPFNEAFFFFLQGGVIMWLKKKKINKNQRVL